MYNTDVLRKQKKTLDNEIGLLKMCLLDTHGDKMTTADTENT